MTLRLETMAEPDALLGPGDAACQASGSFATPCRPAAAGREGDPRWARQYAVAFDGATPVGVLGLYRSRDGRPPDPAYALGGASRELLCASFACGYRETFALYELGMPQNPSPHRRLAYLHALVHALVSYSLGHGHRGRIRLGLAAGLAKTLCGAKTSPMWAFLRPRTDGESR